VADFNCEIEPLGYRTLGELRTELLRRLGYSAQAANPPPGMAELLTSFLQDAQRQTYRQFNVLHTERFFTWTMTPGERFYGLLNNDEDDSAAMAVELDPYKVSWVGVEDLHGTWYPLIQGIPPEFYTQLQASTGWPTHYQIRGCIEVLPAPQEAYKLRIRGHFGLLPFDDPDDVPTIDDHVVFLLALAQAKSHYGQGDAQQYYTQAMSYIQGLVAGSHHTARYVPGRRPEAPLPKPVFLPGD
jgi:hypothetical protein